MTQSSLIRSISQLELRPPSGRTKALDAAVTWEKFAEAAVQVDSAIVERMVTLVAASSLGGRDAVHAATALQHGFDRIVSADRDFDAVPGLRRVDPTELDLA